MMMMWRIWRLLPEARSASEVEMTIHKRSGQRELENEMEEKV